MKKDIKNVDVVTCKLGPALTRISNHRLDVTSEEKQKREKIVEKWKTKVMATKRHKTKTCLNL